MNWTMFWILIVCAINGACIYHFGYLTGKRSEYRKCRSNILKDIIKFEEIVIKLTPAEGLGEHRRILLQLFNHLIQQEYERIHKNAKTNNRNTT